MRNLFCFLIALISFPLFSYAQLPSNPEDISPLLIGEKIPPTEIQTLNGSTKSFEEILNQDPSVVLFYRGGWCPYCNRHLAAVGQVEKEIQALGYKVIAISPDSPEKLTETLGKTKIEYDLFSDASGNLSEAMGIAFQAPERYAKRLNNYSNGKNKGFLPVPALFVIDNDGVILFEYINPNYSKRISSKLLLAVLNGLKKDQ